MNTELLNSEKFIDWVHTKVKLNNNSVSAANRFVKRGDVYWCHFGINIGSEMSKTTPRPAVIVQNHIANKKSSNVIVVPVTHNKATLPCLVPITSIIDSNTGSILLSGQVNTANIVCVSKARLGDLIGRLSSSDMKEIDKSIAKSLDLMRYYQDINKKNEKLEESNTLLQKERDEKEKLLQKLSNFIINYSSDSDTNNVDDFRNNLIKILDNTENS